MTRLAGVVALALCAHPANAEGDSAAGVAPRAGALRVDVSLEHIDISEGEAAVLRYQLAETSQGGSYPRSNYIHPLYDLDGVVLTEDFPADHPWHRGVFWTWHQVLIGDEHVGDPWICEDFQWDVTNVESTPQGDGSQLVRVTNHWRSPAWRPDGVAAPFAEETVSLRVYPATDSRRVIDFEIRLLALTPGLRIGGADNAKGYGGFSLRIKDPLSLCFRGSEGSVQSDRRPVHVGRWLEISNRDDRVHNRVVVLVHKDHPGAVTPWILRSHARAMQNVVYPGRHAAPVPDDPESPLTLRYRLILHRSAVSAARVDAWLADYDAAN